MGRKDEGKKDVTHLASPPFLACAGFAGASTLCVSRLSGVNSDDTHDDEPCVDRERVGALGTRSPRTTVFFRNHVTRGARVVWGGGIVS